MLPLRDNVPTRSFPIVTVGLIVANAIVWLWEFRSGVDSTVIRDGFYPCKLEAPCIGPAAHGLPWYVGVFTSMFMHGGWVHIIGNMLFLWIFGNNVEDALGHARFLLWYLAAGVAAAAAQTAITLAFASAADASIPNIGASGAIAGVLGAYFLLLPNARVLTAFILGFFFFVREIHALWFLGAWFLFQLVDGGFSVLQPQAGGGVAFFAHIGGFAFGLLTVKLVAVRRPLRPAY
jgi:membrane associated rhomboid family serine protease